MLITSMVLILVSCSKETYAELNLDPSPDNVFCSDGTLKVIGAGNIITETLELPNFTGITNLQGIDVTISQGNTQRVTATGYPNLVNKLLHTVKDKTWTIVMEQGCYSNVQLSIDITLPKLELVSLKGSGNIFINSFNQVETLTIDSRGSGNITANSEFTSLTHLNVVNQGSGDLMLYPLMTDNCTMVSAGSGNSAVHAIKALDVTIKGSGNVSYKGFPNITQSISGSGNLINAN